MPLFPRVLHEMQPGMFDHPAFHNRGSVVFRTIINDKNLGIPVLLRDARQHAIQRMLDAGALVIRGNDDT